MKWFDIGSFANSSSRNKLYRNPCQIFGLDRRKMLETSYEILLHKFRFVNNYRYELNLRGSESTRFDPFVNGNVDGKKLSMTFGPNEYEELFTLWTQVK